MIAGHGTGPRKQRALQVALQPHPITAGSSDRTLEVRLTPREHGVELRYLWSGPSAQILWPDRVPHPDVRGERRDYLWHHTCGEWFIGEVGSPGYIEFNFSPSGHWAAYRFADYRQSLGDLVWEGSPPEIEFSLEAQRAELRAWVPWAAFASFVSEPVREWQLGFTCVVERSESVLPAGTASADTLEYWAVSHPRAQPEFHDRRGFSVSW